VARAGRTRQFTGAQQPLQSRPPARHPPPVPRLSVTDRPDSPAHFPRRRRRSGLRTLSAIALASALAGALAWAVVDYVHLRRDYGRLDAEVRRLEARGLTREELQTRLAEELAHTRATVTNLVRERELGRALLEEHGGGICLLHVAYRYVDARTGSPMALVRPGAGGAVVLVHDVFGTGFPVAPGILLSNRHVLEPWWQNPEADTKAQQGFIPQTIGMRAFCPGAERPLAIEPVAVSPTLDLATARLKNGRLEALPVAPPERRVLSGFSVFLLGYPTGLEAALARAPEAEQAELVPLLRKAPGELADSLLAHRLIQPLLTRGRVSEVRPGQITFDAPTARGSSGGPLFNLRGEVIGVTTAILPSFAAANFAIPLDSGNPLLRSR
jgi:hypothetical protein